MKYYIIVASKDHVAKGVEGGFAQAGHGKKSSLAKMAKGDWVIYYSGKESLKGGKPYQKFSAIGRVKDDEPYQVKVSEDFQPWRRNIDFHDSEDVEIRPLLDDLQFITNREKWGMHLKSGFVEIKKQDFELIAGNMLTDKSILAK